MNKEYGCCQSEPAAKLIQARYSLDEIMSAMKNRTRVRIDGKEGYITGIHYEGMVPCSEPQLHHWRLYLSGDKISIYAS